MDDISIPDLTDIDFEINKVKGFDGEDDIMVEERKMEPIAGHIRENDKKITVSFKNFVDLVNNRNYDHITDEFGDEDLSLSSELLVKLAALDSKDKKNNTPYLFVVGLMVGAIIVFMVIK